MMLAEKPFVFIKWKTSAKEALNKMIKTKQSQLSLSQYSFKSLHEIEGQPNVLNSKNSGDKYLNFFSSPIT